MTAPSGAAFPFWSIADLRAAYASFDLTPTRVVELLHAGLAGLDDAGIFLHVVPLAEALARARVLEETPVGQRGPLFGVPFAVKDNIDVAGLPTTAACPAFAYTASETAACVQQLLDAGALLIGKTNLDQFATGLVGLRTPYTAPKNPFDPRVIPGGSSSGSAVAVARGLVPFALGTDTAGSGRVPAAMNNIVGAKPTRRVLDLRGVVPACRAQDCVSVFALTVEDCAEVLAVLDTSPPPRRLFVLRKPPAELRLGVLGPAELVIDDPDTARLYHGSVAALEALGAKPVAVPYGTFLKAAKALYEDAWVAQRLEATRGLLHQDPDALLPVLRGILEGALGHTAEAAYRAEAQRQLWVRGAERVFSSIDVLLLPTIPGPLSVEQVEADPLGSNSRLGRYTNFVNLLDLCALAVPAGLGVDGVPRGVMLVAPAMHDDLLLGLGAALQACTSRSVGKLERAPPAPVFARSLATDEYSLVVAGAHMSGMVLNGELIEKGARLLRRTRTAPLYKLFALDTTPPKPGLVRAPGQGSAIDCELWVMSSAALSTFASSLPQPMCLGQVALADGTSSLGFLCEPCALEGASDITHLGGWRAYVEGQPAGDAPRAGASQPV